jgi:hypothetical protein
MTESQKIPWKRISIEATAIVASILLAFAIDAWWNSRSDAIQEQALLLALSDDFDAAANVLTLVKRMHAVTAESGEKLISYGDADNVPEADRDGVDLLIGMHFARTIFNPPMGTVQSVIGSGRIDLIANQELVAELTQWSSLVSKLNILEIEAREHFYDRIYPYLAERLNLKDLDKGYPQFLDSFPWEQAQTDSFLLVSEEEFLNIVYVHWVIKTNIISAFEPVEASLTRIRNLIAKELSN